MFEQSLKNIDDVLRADNAGSALDYIEQTSWILFLKYLDDLENDRQKSAKLTGKEAAFILQPEYRWQSWACPKTTDGKLAHQRVMDGDDLSDFVNLKLFPYLKGFRVEDSNTIENKIGEIFHELKNKIQSGYSLRNILDIVDKLHFQTDEEKHELSHLYESKIQNMGNAGRDGGQYYTPRPLIRTIVKVVNPQIGETIYDGACGSAGFLVEAFNYMSKDREKLSSSQWNTLQTKTFYGKEKMALPYIISIMNMILHGIETPNIKHTNTLSENLADVQEKDRFDVVLANPPFGGKERKEVQHNFPIKTGETAFLFMQHFIKMMKAGGKAGVVIKNTFLSNTDNASAALRKLLLESCNLHTVLDLPSGSFQGAGVKTVVLFFDKGTPTKKIWYYQLNLDRNLGKVKPLSEIDLADFVELQKVKSDSNDSWSLDVKDVDQKSFDLSVNNPMKNDKKSLRSPQIIIADINELDTASKEIIDGIRRLF